MKATVRFIDGGEREFHHVGGHATTQNGYLMLLNGSSPPVPIAVLPPGATIIYPENDTEIVRATSIVGAI